MEETHPIILSIQRQMKVWIDEMEKNGHKVSREEYDKHFNEVMAAHTSMPDPEFNGYTTDQMREIVNHPFQPGCPVQLHHLTKEEISQIPIMRQALSLLNALSEKEIKLTAKGYLPPKMVEELYLMGTRNEITEMYKQRNEPRCETVQILRQALTGSGLIKNRLGKLSLTAKGKKLLNDHNELLRFLMNYLFTDYDTGWLDLSEDKEVGNMGRAYSLWLLHHFGDQWRNIGFYASEYHKAYPSLDDIRRFPVRTFIRFFNVIGVSESNPRTPSYLIYQNEEVRKTPILDMMFSFEEPAKI